MTSYEKEGEKSIILKRIRFASKNPFESLTTTNSYYYDFFSVHPNLHGLQDETKVLCVACKSLHSAVTAYLSGHSFHHSSSAFWHVILQPC